MTGSERLPALGVGLLDSHVGIPETNDFFLPLVTGLHHKLLAARLLPTGFVASHFGFIDLSHYSGPPSLMRIMSYAAVTKALFDRTEARTSMSVFAGSAKGQVKA